MRVVGLDSCRKLYYPEPITKNMLCAGDVQGQKGFCEVSPVQPASLPLMQRRFWESHRTSPPQFPQKCNGSKGAEPPLSQGTCDVPPSSVLSQRLWSPP